VQHFHRRAAQHLASLGATVLAHDDRSRFHFLRNLQDLHRRRSNTGVDCKAVERWGLASESAAYLLCCQLMLTDVQNVEGRTLDLAEHLCHRQRRQRLFRAVEGNEDDRFAHESSLHFWRSASSRSVSSCHWPRH
jgi:hypothetical protein